MTEPAGFPAQSDPSWQHLPGHPRLFADRIRLLALKEQVDPVSMQLKDLLFDAAGRHLTAPAIVCVDTGAFLLEAMRGAQDRIISLALAHRISGEDRYYLKAREELLRLAALPDWGRSHFLDVGEAAHAAGTGLDWLFDRLDADERDRITESIVNKALLPSLDAEEGRGGWVDGDYNWNQVCHTGLVVGALAVAEREPALARRIVDRALKNVPKAMAAYAPDGSYPEGPSYWSYGTTFNVIMIEALRSAFGNSFGLELAPGFLKTADFRIQMTGPSGEDYDFSDYHRERQDDPVMLWFARELGRKNLAGTELAMLANLHRNRPGPPDGPPATRIRSSRHLPLGILWWDPGLPVAQDPQPLHWVATGGLPVAAMRSAWNDPRATYVAVKGGTPNNSHGHMDSGSFILEACGVRWALDLGTENYRQMRAANLDLWNYSQDSTRWTTFRVGPEGHNIIRFDGRRQEIAGKAGILSGEPASDAKGAIIDLTPLYRGQVDSVRRSVALNPDATVVIEDEWKAGARPVEVSWQWLTRAEAKITDRGLVLRQAGETLELRVETSATAKIEIEDVSRPRLPQDSPNPGLQRIVIRLHTSAGETGRIAVHAIPGNP